MSASRSEPERRAQPCLGSCHVPPWSLRLLPSSWAPPLAPPARESPSIWASPRIRSRVSIMVPVTATCSPFDPSLTPINSFLSVAVEQAAKQQIAHGQGVVGGFMGTSPFAFQCDGAPNAVSSICAGGCERPAVSQRQGSFHRLRRRVGWDSLRLSRLFHRRCQPKREPWSSDRDHALVQDLSAEHRLSFGAYYAARPLLSGRGGSVLA